MEVAITNFRCYYRNNPTVYYFPNGLCHLTGESGAGKSTVIMAIEWCLYGKNTGVKPRGKPTLVPEVSIRFENFMSPVGELDDEKNDVVLERKSPNFITVFLPNNIVLDADAAQGWINQNFGSRDLWNATSCLFQGTRNIILSGTGEEKFKILRELTYGSDVGDINDPDWYLNTLRDKYKEMSKNADSIRTKYEAFYDYLEPILDEFDIRNNWDPDNEDIEDIQKKILDLSKSQRESRKAWADYKSAQTLQLKLESAINNLPDDIDSKITEYSLEVEKLTSKLVEINSSSSLRKLQDRVTNALVANGKVQKYEYNPKLYTSISNALTQRRNFETNCKRYGIPANTEVISSWILELQSLVEYNQDLEKYNASKKQIQERDSLEKKLQNAKTELIPEVTTDSDSLDSMMVSLTKEKSELNNNLICLKSKIVCPKCTTSIILDKGVRKTFDPEDETKFKERLEEISEILGDLNSQISAVQLVNNLQSRLDKYNECVSISEEPIQPLVKLVSSTMKQNPCNSLQICKNLQDQFTPNLSDEDLERLQILERGNDLKDLILDPDVNIEELLEKDLTNSTESALDVKRLLETSKNNLQKYKDLFSNRKALVSQMAGLQICKPSEELPEYYDSKISSLNERLSQGKEFEKIKKENDQLCEKKVQVDAEAAKVNTMANLIDIVKRVSLQPMEEVINAINVVTNNILEELYDSPINILLSVFRNQDDSKTASKMSVNIQIFYGEEVYPNIANLSGGEADRVSLALTLALSKIHHSPMLIFDECMASLNCDYREKCMKVIKDTLHDSNKRKSVFDICHESVEGYHDTVVPISKF